NFNVDANGTLVTSSGKSVMGWRVDSEGEVIRDRVKSLPIMSEDKMKTPPEATTKSTVFGNVNRSDDSFADGGSGNVPLAVQFYDQLGYEYSANFIIEQQNNGVDGKYTVKLESVTQGAEVIWSSTPAPGATTPTATFEDMILEFNMTNADVEVNRADHDNNAGTTEDTDGTVKVGPGGVINPEPTKEYDFSTIIPTMGKLEIDFSTVTNYGSSTTVDSERGDLEHLGKGKSVGEMSSLSVQKDGKIIAAYSNGDIKCVGQIAVATFANAAGLEKIGDNLYAATMNSGEFNGIGQDITADGGSFSTGVLEMSNVDLSSEFTEMIVTQRGFQANSRIITTSDSMLEELINLKR
ncbi:MAG: flagellar hook-basal body complex protein, partial [Lachnospiraceae bacterium]|nr:flagellar hook-basal body complex protein [Lachnospiraceae bacterium]